MRGAVWQLQRDSGAPDLVLESLFAGDEIAAVASTWLGRLWQWMSRSGLQLRLRGRSAEVACKGGGCDCDHSLVRGLKGNTKRLAVSGCSEFRASTVSDLLERGGAHVRTELRAGGKWTNTFRDNRSGQEWVALMRTQLVVEDGRGVVSVCIPYTMPCLSSLCVLVRL
jgi:hypothetical protein